MQRFYVVEKAKLKCTFGTSLGKLVVTSQRKLEINGKLQATQKDKQLEPPFFGNCTCKSNYPPCAPALQEWQVPGRKAGIETDAFIMDDSSIQCSQGGVVSVVDANQDLVSTGEDECELDKILPKFEGEIIFVNGYLSNPKMNTESHYNAIMDKNPDEPNSGALTGENTNEHDRTHADDVYTADEHNHRAKRDKWQKLWEDEIKTRLWQPLSPLIRFSYTPEEKFQGYWNSKTNKMKGTELYAKHFNAVGNEHFINGSHGLGSNAAHRIDHGIAQGYSWAKKTWNIKTWEQVEAGKGENPYIETFSPAYKPVTIVGHSQGAAMAAGVAIGILKYAADMGYKKAPLNIIFLGVHQPKNLTGDEYEKLYNYKTKYLEVNNFFLKLLGEKENTGREYLNSISDLFNPKYHKLKNERGIYEHLKKIIGNWSEFKDRCVQFTFTNDRGDLVLRDGDIPGIDSACNPKRDTTLYSVEFFSKRNQIPSEYETDQDKLVVDLSNEETGVEGFVVIPPYIANRRFDFDALEKMDNPSKEEKENGVEWGNYRNVCIQWGIAMAKYKRLKKKYNEMARDKWYVPYYNRDSNILFKNLAHLKVDWEYIQTARWYAPMQAADLYAHFSPVGLINHKKILSDFEEYCDDTVGTTESIWERIKKLGEEKFYRIQDEGRSKGGQSEDTIEKRKLAIKYVQENKGIKHTPTSVANSPYIINVISAFVEGNKSAHDQIYREPLKLDIGINIISKEQITKSIYQNKEKTKRLHEIKRDNTIVKKL